MQELAYWYTQPINEPTKKAHAKIATVRLRNNKHGSGSLYDNTVHNLLYWYIMSNEKRKHLLEMDVRMLFHCAVADLGLAKRGNNTLKRRPIMGA